MLSAPHFLIATTAVVTVVAVRVLQRQRIPMAIAIAAVLSVATLLPSPSYSQYFCIVMPFLVVGALDLVPIIRSAFTSTNETQLAQPLRVCGVATIALLLIASAQQVDATEQSHLLYPSPSNVRTVSRAIDAIAHPGEVVLASWPGWLYETHTLPLPGTESDFIPGVAASSHLTSEHARQYHMLTLSEIAQTIRSRRLRVIVYGFGFGSPSWKAILAQARYRPARTFAHATIYVEGGLNAGSPPAGRSSSRRPRAVVSFLSAVVATCSTREHRGALGDGGLVDRRDESSRSGARVGVDQLIRR